MLESPFDVAACCMLALKLKFGESAKINDFLATKLHQADQWMTLDLSELQDVKPCLKFIETVVYDS